MAEPVSTGDVASWPLWLLVRVSALSMWRRLESLFAQSRLLTGVLFLFIAGYWVLAYWLFYQGLRFVARFPGLGAPLTERLMFLLFAFLSVLLLLSNLVISYSNLFRNRETTYLLTLPVSRNTVFQWKFIESTLLASWAFLFLVAPLLAAYGQTRGVTWHYYPAALALVVVFIVLPGAAGSFAAVNVARYLDRRIFQTLTLAGLAALVAGLFWWFRPEPGAPEESETRVLGVLERLLYRTRFAEFAWLPSQWLSTSVLHWAEGALNTAVSYGLVLVSYALFFGALAMTTLGNLFYDAASTVQGRSSVLGRWGWFRARRGRSPLAGEPGLAERLLERVHWLGPDQRALMLKDFRAFWRDTAQWAQSLMLFGLLAVYIFNVRHFSKQLNHAYWMHLISFLNLGACSLNLATLTTRFVYPQFSLEGKRLWIVGMAPMGLVQVVRAKFLMAAVASLVITLGLITLSCYMLDMPTGRTVFFGGAVTVMTFTLTGLATGLGALYPNFREENPSKIVSGFGGTFCLVLSFLYILASVVLLAFAVPWTPLDDPSYWRTAFLLGVFVALSAVIGWLPLRLGLRRVKTFEL
jgi:ABC-2 type transport system permease protein